MMSAERIILGVDPGTNVMGYGVLRVQFHCGEMDGCWPGELTKWAELFTTVNFDFAHCRPMAEMAHVVATHTNVFTDCSYMESVLMSLKGLPVISSKEI